jgi:hypothetical protein
MVDLTYKTAWFMLHRVREGMSDPNAAPIGRKGKIVATDEAYHGKRGQPHVSPQRKGRPSTKPGKNGGGGQRKGVWS